jgi:GGDEF domain-containing protein
VGVATLALAFWAWLFPKPKAPPLTRITEQIRKETETETAYESGSETDTGSANEETVEETLASLLLAMQGLLPQALTVAVFFADSDRKNLILRSFAGSSRAVRPDTLCGEHSSPALLLKEDVPSLLLDESDNLVLPYYDENETPHIRSCLGVPLLQGYVRMGALWADSASGNAFDEDSLSALKSLATVLSVAFQNTYALARSEDAEARLRGFLGDLQKIAEAKSQNGLMENLKLALSRHFQSHRMMCLSLLPMNKARVLFVQGDEQEFWEGREFPLDSKSLLAVPLLEGELIQKDFTSDDPKFYACRVHELERRNLKIKSLLAAPVFSLMESCMVLCLESRVAYAYGDEEEQLLECLATGASAALSRMQALREREERKTDDALTCAKLLSPVMEWALASPGKYAAILTGIDDLMLFNANSGFTAGDAALRAFAQLLGSAAQEKPDCKLARYSGDTFLLLQRNGLVTDFQVLAERLRKAWSHAEFHLTASFAVGSLAENSLLDLERTLYQAKAQGKNKVLNAPRP